MLSRESILSADDLAKTVVPVPEWGGEVAVRMLTGTERDALYASLRSADGAIDGVAFRGRLLVRTIVGDDGKRMFADDEVELVNSKSASVLDRLYEAADKLNSTGAAAVEEQVKN
jgi:hypothetical protein